jgi:serine/threonine protein kinase
LILPIAMEYPLWEEYVKRLHKEELEAYLMIDKLRKIHPILVDVAPKILKIRMDPFSEQGIYYVLITERYSTTLKELMKTNKNKSIMVMERAKLLVKTLHGLNILHGDLHEGNVVYDEPTNRVSLIDFENTINLTEFLSKVNPNIHMYGPTKKEDEEYLEYVEDFGLDLSDPLCKFTTKDQWLFDLEFTFFDRLKRRIDYLD